MAALQGSCATGTLNKIAPAHQALAAEEWSTAVKSGVVPVGKSRVYVFLGHWHFPEAQFFKVTANLNAADIYANQINIGGVNPGECLVIDLPPGFYSFDWLERSRYPYATIPLKKTLAAGEAYFLSVERDQRLSRPPPDSVVGYFMEQQGGLSIVKPMTIVLPDASAVDRVMPDVR